MKRAQKQIIHNKKYIFTGGCPRSGTSALTKIIGRHSYIVLGNERYNKRLHKNNFQLNPSFFEKNRFYRMEEGDTFYDNFNKFNTKWDPKIKKKYDKAQFIGVKYNYIHQIYPELNEYFPGHYIVYIYRDIFDVAESWQKRLLKGENWGPNMDYKMAVRMWNESLSMTIEALKNGSNIICVNYNSLFAGTKDLDAILGFLGLQTSSKANKALKKARRKYREIQSKKNEQLCDRDFIKENADFPSFYLLNKEYDILR